MFGVIYVKVNYWCVFYMYTTNATACYFDLVMPSD